MKTFHSSGTPAGKEAVMWTGKRTIPISASVASVPPLESSSTSGRENSTAVPPYAASVARRDGRTSSG